MFSFKFFFTLILTVSMNHIHLISDIETFGPKQGSCKKEPSQEKGLPFSTALKS